MHTKHEADASQKLPSGTTETKVEEAIVAWAEELVEKCHPKIAPIDVEKLAMGVGIKEIHKENISADGILSPIQGGFILTLNRNQCLERQRFTCAHEIAHTFFVPSGCAQRPGESQKTVVKNLRERETERLCDIAATHILMPDEMFKREALECGLSIEAIPQLAHTFQTSLSATAIRLVEISPIPLITIFSKVFDRPESCPKLRVRWSTQNVSDKISKRYFIPTNVPVDKHASIRRAYETGRVCRGFESMNMGNLKGTYYVESKGFGATENRYAASLVFLHAQSKAFI